MAVQFFTSANTIDTSGLPGPFSTYGGTVAIGQRSGPYGINTIHITGSGFCSLYGVSVPHTSGLVLGFGIVPAQGGGQIANLDGKGTLSIGSDGSISFAMSGGGTLSSSPLVITFNKHHYIELFISLLSANPATCSIYVDAVRVANGTVSGVSSMTNPISDVFIKNDANQIEHTFDSVYLFDTTTSYNNAPLGTPVVGVIKAIAPGTFNQFTPNGAATNYQAVDNFPPDGDTIYCASNASSQEVSVKMGPLLLPMKTIAAASVVIDSKQLVANSTIQVGIGNTATFAYTADIDQCDDYNMITVPFNTDPSGNSWALSTSTSLGILQAAVINTSASGGGGYGIGSFISNTDFTGIATNSATASFNLDMSTGGTLKLNNYFYTPTAGGAININGAGQFIINNGGNLTVDDNTAINLTTGSLRIHDVTLTIASSATCTSNSGSILPYFSYSQGAGHTINFTDASYVDGSGGSVASWSWNFGDTGSSTSQNPAHTYSASGLYTVVLTATDSSSNSGTCSIAVTVA